jgi:Chaperone of endosialidase
MKIIHSAAACLTLAFGAASAHAQNVGIGFSNPQSKLSVNGNLAVGANYNLAAPANGAVFQNTVGIGTTSPDPNSMLHIFNPNQSEQIIEGGGGGNGTFPVLRFVNDSTRSDPVPEFGRYTRLANRWRCKGDGSNWFVIYDQTTKISRILIDPTGKVGFSIDPPRAYLDVPNGANLSASGGTISFFSFGTNNTIQSNSVTTAATTASAVFGQNVFSGGSFMSYSGSLTASDARLKNIIGRSDSAKDLETLKKIEVTDYTMKDAVAFGSKPFKKVIAQQVEQVYPTAVKTAGLKAVTFTPDIYAVSTSVKPEKPGVYAISLDKAHDLKDGEIVRIITEDNEHDLQLTTHVVNDKTFIVETPHTLGNKVFVYGKNCMDLKSVDYAAISMLNVSATQELAKEVEALRQQNSDLQDQAKRLTAVEQQERATIAKQEADILALKAANEKLTAMAAKMEALEKAVATMQEKENGGARTVALSQ